ncbi:POT family domain-containing protein [Ditylenchus destructor]|nr:POT family domain-containing protein [Ditylenchus destructor]
MKPVEGTGEFSLGIDLAFEYALSFENEYSGHLALCRNDTEGTTKEHPCDPRRNSDFVFYLKGDDAKDEEGNKAISPVGNNTTSRRKAFVYNYKSIKPGAWKLYEMYNVPKKVGQLTLSKEQVQVRSLDVEIEVQGQGGVYLMVLTGTKDKVRVTGRIVNDHFSSDNLIPIYWQIPQIAIITSAEILFSITGYEFAYSQAAPSMKSLVQAFWLLTTSAGMMLVVMIVFALMSIFYYKYNYYTGDDGSDLDDFELEAKDWAVDAPKDALSRRMSSPNPPNGGIDNYGYANDKRDPEYNWQDRF